MMFCRRPTSLLFACTKFKYIRWEWFCGICDSPHNVCCTPSFGGMFVSWWGLPYDRELWQCLKFNNCKHNNEMPLWLVSFYFFNDGGFFLTERLELDMSFSWLWGVATTLFIHGMQHLIQYYLLMAWDVKLTREKVYHIVVGGRVVMSHNKILLLDYSPFLFICMPQ